MRQAAVGVVGPQVFRDDELDPALALRALTWESAVETRAPARRRALWNASFIIPRNAILLIEEGYRFVIFVDGDVGEVGFGEYQPLACLAWAAALAFDRDVYADRGSADPRGVGVEADNIPDENRLLELDFIHSDGDVAVRRLARGFDEAGCQPCPRPPNHQLKLVANRNVCL